MEAPPNQRQNTVTLILIVLGIIAIGWLIYIVIDRLGSPAQTDQAPDAVSENVVEQSPSPQPPAPVEQTEVPVGIRVGQRAPDFLLPSLDNETIALSDYRGKVVILDFWASWCGPCKLTMPTLENYAQALADDVVLIGVSLDRQASDASDYLSANHYEAVVALYGSYAAAVKVFETYGGGGIPKTFVIDRAGVIRYVGHPASLSRQAIEGWI